jgi:hypothetical protein
MYWQSTQFDGTHTEVQGQKLPGQSQVGPQNRWHSDPHPFEDWHASMQPPPLSPPSECWHALGVQAVCA